MAKQVGPFFITGTIDKVCFYQLDGSYYARAKSSLDWKRVKKDPINLEAVLSGSVVIILILAGKFSLKSFDTLKYCSIELGRIRAEIDHLKNENDTYKKRFALLPVTVMHIRSSSHLLNHNMPKDLQPLEAMAEKMGGFVGITSRFKNVTTIAFSFPNMPLAA